jgi:hypothetical protein
VRDREGERVTLVETYILTIVRKIATAPSPLGEAILAL